MTKTSYYFNFCLNDIHKILHLKLQFLQMKLQKNKKQKQFLICKNFEYLKE